jgi:hypothetical protein
MEQGTHVKLTKGGLSRGFSRRLVCEHPLRVGEYAVKEVVLHVIPK